MPIIKENYPPNWRDISLQVRSEADWRCEWCGAPQKQVIRRTATETTTEMCGREYRIDWEAVHIVERQSFGAVTTEITAKMKWPQLKLHGLTRIILTTAHLDRNPKNNARKNLAAQCQRSHLRHDILQHVASRKYGRMHHPDHQLKLNHKQP